MVFMKRESKLDLMACPLFSSISLGGNLVQLL